MERVSDKPFGDALRTLMDERGLSYRSLAEQTRAIDGKGMSHAHLNMLANGHEKPSMRAIALIAQVCEVQPAYFAQYRLAAAMRELDPAEVGLDQALQNLNARLGDQRRSDARACPRAKATSKTSSQRLAIGSSGLSARVSSRNHDSHAICTPRRVISG